jgi:site-specific DNA-methyltransferase (adenine-specific)
MIKLLKGDCLEIMKTIESGSIDAIITDPPYGTTACKWDSVIDFELMWEQLNRIIKPNGAIILFGSEPFSSALRMSNIKNYKYDWVWEKSHGAFAVAKIRPLPRTETISIFANNKTNYYPQMVDRIGKIRDRRKEGYMKSGKGNSKDSATNPNISFKYADDYKPNMAYPKNIIKIPNPSDKRLHPTQKPVALMEYLIKTYTNENGTVLDFTMGSGITFVAAQNTNRNVIGIVQDENYFKIAKKRIEENDTTNLFNE